MAKKKRSSFIATKEKTVPITGKISESLNERIIAIQDNLNKLDPDLKFCTTTIIAEKIEEAVKSAEAELALMTKGVPDQTAPIPKPRSTEAQPTQKI